MRLENYRITQRRTDGKFVVEEQARIYAAAQQAIAAPTMRGDGGHAPVQWAHESSHNDLETAKNRIRDLIQPVVVFAAPHEAESDQWFLK